MRTKNRTRALALSALAAAALVAGCGSGGHSGHAGTATTGMTGMDHGSGKQAGAVDRAFLAEMVPHHESAVQMAEIAGRRGQHMEIKTLAGNIIRTQSAEIGEMQAISGRLEVKLDHGSMNHGSMGHGASMGNAATLGIPEGQMGMSMKTDDLKTANPFDRAFVDMMIEHHAGAIRMARAELAKGQDPQLKKLAGNIIAEQTEEIGEMNQWRTTWYGKPSPAGGAPKA